MYIIGLEDMIADTNTFVIQNIIDWVMNAGIKIIISLLVLLISYKIISFIFKRLEKAILNPSAKKKKNKENPIEKVLGDRNLQIHKDKTIIKTALHLTKISLKIAILIALLGYLGIETSIFSSVVASLGVCIGLAVNGTLSNFAGGVLLLLTRPIRVDDYIEACGYSGTVEEIHIVFTVLRTPDNKIIYIPNGDLSSSSIVNYSVKDVRRVDLMYSVSYNADFEKAKQVILATCLKHELVLKDPAPMARLKDHASSSLDIVTRVWAKSSDYWTVYFDLQEQIKLALDEANIEIPYDQLDVHIRND